MNSRKTILSPPQAKTRFSQRSSIRVFVKVVSTINQYILPTFVAASLEVGLKTNKYLTIIPDLHTRAGTAAGPDGNPITKIKTPHIGGHEGIGRIVSLGPDITHETGVKVGALVGIRFSSRICRRCEFCLAGTEQYCVQSTNHLHHEDGSFSEYIALDADYLTILPDDCDPVVMGPVLCAGLTAYKVSRGCCLARGIV